MKPNIPIEALIEKVTTTAEGALLRVHGRVYLKSGGRIGQGILGVPCLILTTTGRRSGQPRSVALVFATSGDDLVIAASNGGSDSPPNWLANLRANPAVTIQTGRLVRPVTATVVERGAPNYERLWHVINLANRGRYYGYQRKTKRPIPLVVLSPRS